VLALLSDELRIAGWIPIDNDDLSDPEHRGSMRP
jgi:hypothetical protein